MAWVPRPGSFHYGRTESDYKHLIKLHEFYRLKKPPLEELKEAALADGYPPEKVAKFRYIDMSKIDIHRLLNPKKYKNMEPEPIDESDNESCKEEEGAFDVDEFCSDAEEEEYYSDHGE